MEKYENSLVGAPQLPEISEDLSDYTEEINVFMEKTVEEFQNMPITERYMEFYKQKNVTQSIIDVLDAL